MDSPAPLHHQIASTLRAELQSGQLKQGDHFTTEKQLVARFGVSVTTVRRALQTLVDEGYLVRRAGRGTLVRRAQFDSFSAPLLGSLEEMEARGTPVTARVLASEQRPATPELAARLALAAGEGVFWMRRLLSSAEGPVAIDEAYWPAQLGAALLEQEPTTRLYGFLEEHLGVQLGEAEAEISARAARAEEAELLRLPVGSPVLVVERTVYTTDGRPLDVDRTIHRGDNYTFRTRMLRQLQRRLGVR